MQKTSKKTPNTLLILSIVEFVIIILLGGLLLQTRYDYMYRLSPAVTVFDTDNKNATYIISVASPSGNYIISPYQSKTGGSGSYVSASPVSLNQFVNKKVEVSGRFVKASSVLHANGYPDSSWNPPVGAFEITTIQLAE